MVEEDSNIEKTTKISLTGDTKTCNHCQTDEKKLQEHESIGYQYEYVDVNSDRGQEQLKLWGVKEGETVPIPIIKAETCSWDKNNPGDKKCKTTDWKDSFWHDLEQGKLPSEVTET